MLILTMRTDKPEAELGIYDSGKRVAYYTWQAHRELAETIHLKITETLTKQKLEIASLQGVVVFKGPGSFTGLRIGISVANALAHGLSIPIVGVVGDGWVEEGIARLNSGESDRLVIPEYGAPVHITQPKH